MPRTALAAALALLPAATLACPTAADLAGGIALDFADGSRETYTALRDDLVRSEYLYAGEVESIVDLALGVYLLTYMEVRDGSPEPGTRVTTSYPGGMGTLPRPEAGQRWSRTAVVLDSSGPYAEEVTVAWGALSELAIGDCAYAVLEGIVAYDSGEPYFEGIAYLPDLGIGFVTWYEDETGRDSYTATGIAALD